MEKHLAVTILYNGQNKVLLQHRTSDAPTYPSQYTIFGGKIEKGEEPKVAAKRECFEELEYVLNNHELFKRYTYESEYGKRVKYVFMEKYDTKQKLVLHEGQGMKWIEPKDIDELVIIDHDLIVLDDFFSKVAETN